MNGSLTAYHLKPTALRYLIRIGYSSYVIAAFDSETHARAFAAGPTLEVYDNKTEEVIQPVHVNKCTICGTTQNLHNVDLFGGAIYRCNRPACLSITSMVPP